MVYLDHNATSPLLPRARDAMLAALDAGGNASSVHGPGRGARARVEEARSKVAILAGADPSSVVFTAGGSEANALALRGAVYGALAAEDRLTRIFVSAVEHESVRANAAALSESVPGIRLTEIPVDGDGVVDLAAFRLLLMQGKGRALVSVMAANNETGVVQPISDIVAVIRKEGGEDALIHVDAAQIPGKAAIAFADPGIDYMSLSAHKFGGPQGAGALILREGVPFAPLSSGAQESGRRGGTENVAAIAGFGAAAEEATPNANDMAKLRHLRHLRDRFEAGLRSLDANAVIFGARRERLSNTSNFALPGLSAEAALIALDLDGIAISSGAACSSGKVRSSHVLAAMGVGETLARCGLRVSFGHSNTEGDVDAVLASLARIYERMPRLNAA